MRLLPPFSVCGRDRTVLFLSPFSYEAVYRRKASPGSPLSSPEPFIPAGSFPPITNSVNWVLFFFLLPSKGQALPPVELFNADAIFEQISLPKPTNSSFPVRRFWRSAFSFSFFFFGHTPAGDETVDHNFLMTHAWAEFFLRDRPGVWNRMSADSFSFFFFPQRPTANVGPSSFSTVFFSDLYGI